MSESKLLRDFLEAQREHMHVLNSHAPGPTSKKLINKKSKEIPTEGEEGLDYIIEKKPAPKKVAKYLQGLIDEIAAENDM